VSARDERTNLLDSLELLQRNRVQLDTEIQAAVRRCREYTSWPEITWDDIGKALGVTKQSAHKKYRHLEPEKRRRSW
jgi:hypothetical protein